MSQVLAFLKRYEVISGIALLLAVNLLLVVWKPLARVDPESLPAAHTWVWWATRQFQEQKRAPDVVLLGSSLVMHPISRADADYLGIDLDYVKHHRSVYLEQTLISALKLGGVVCYNFALPGGMISDDFIVMRSLLSGQRKPKVIVLGLSLRDFIDNGVHCAGATPAFRYLKRYTNIDDLIELSMPQIWQRMDYISGNAVYLWGKKLDLQVALAEQLKERLLPVVRKTLPESRLPEADLKRNLPSNLRAEVEAGMMIVKAHSPHSYEDNSAEYKKRYRSPNQEMFDTQEKFLALLLKEAQAQGTKVLIVNMPLTPANHRLMPAGSYDRYLTLLRTVSRQQHLAFIDLDTDKTFSEKDFYDTSHMNGGGGKKLVQSIVDGIAAKQEVAAALGSDLKLAGQGHSY